MPESAKLEARNAEYERFAAGGRAVHELQELLETVTEHSQEDRLAAMLAGVCLLVPGYLGARESSFLVPPLVPFVFQLLVAGLLESATRFYDGQLRSRRQHCRRFYFLHGIRVCCVVRPSRRNGRTF